MNPGDLTPREAWIRYVDRRRPEATEHSATTYHYRLKQFVEFLEEEGVERVAELSGWTFENYETKRAGDGVATVTLNGEMGDVRLFVKYLERIEAVDEDLHERVHVPKVSPDEESSDIKLDTADAKEFLSYYRRFEFGSRRHVFLGILWDTGCRLGAIRGLDVRDYDSEEQFLEFRHRPESETPLKQKSAGERPVALMESTAAAIDAFLASDDRWDTHDEYGREPLVSGRQGRPSQNTVRVWAYLATLPCIHSECPHGKDPEACEFTKRNQASKCPSSRSPHQIRTGSITWQLDRGLPPEVVAERVNASVATIKKHYDKATARERMELRRRQYIDQLEFEE